MIELQTIVDEPLKAATSNSKIIGYILIALIVGILIYFSIKLSKDNG